MVYEQNNFFRSILAGFDSPSDSLGKFAPTGLLSKNNRHYLLAVFSTILVRSYRTIDPVLQRGTIWYANVIHRLSPPSTRNIQLRFIHLLAPLQSFLWIANSINQILNLKLVQILRLLPNTTIISLQMVTALRQHLKSKIPGSKLSKQLD